jgi:glutamate-1-semialdehyde 2,1-aminomutase
VGAYGGRAELMDMIAPLGPVYQAGTLSGNPLAMAAGLATLRDLKTRPEIYQQLEQRSAALVDGVLAVAKTRGVPLTSNRVGSMFTWFFQPGVVHDWDTAAKSDTQAFGKFHRAMLEQGIYLPPSQYEAMFMSAAHSDADIGQTIAAAAEAL